MTEEQLREVLAFMDDVQSHVDEGVRLDYSLGQIEVYRSWIWQAVKSKPEPLAMVEGWISEADFSLDGKGLGTDSYLWLWRELPRELKGGWGYRPVTVTIAGRTPSG